MTDATPLHHTAAELRRVVVTRPQPQADEWVERLAALGQPAVALPLMHIEADPDFDAQVREAWAQLGGFRLAQFVSPNAVQAFVARKPAEATWPAGVLAGATGPGTVAALEAAGVPAEQIVAPSRDSAHFDGETLWEQQLQHRDWRGASVLLVRGESGREWLSEHLRQAGAAVQVLAAYRRRPPAWVGAPAALLHDVLAQAERHLWLFSSSQAIGFLVDHLRALGRFSEAVAMPVLATHPRIAETARAAGFTQVHTVSPYPGAVAAWLEQHPAAAPAAPAEVEPGPSIESIAAPPMMEQPGTPSADRAAAAPSAAARPATPDAPRWTRVVLGAALVLAVAALVVAWQALSGLRDFEREVARRQQGSNQQAAEAMLLAKQSQDLVRDTAAKVAVIDTRLAEVALQRTQLEELIQSLSRTRDDNLVSDIDAAVRLAVQQTSLTSSAEPLVAALRGADERLARASQPRLERVRRAIARDLERVRAAGSPELGSLMVKLDEAARLVDEAPLLSQPAVARNEPPRPANRAPRAATAAASSAAAPWWQPVESGWQSFWASAGQQASQLLRVTRIDQPEAMLVAPDQAVFLRENIKLRLLNARLSLLSRRSEAAQGDLQMAMSALQRYFDTGSRRTQGALELLRQCAQQSQLTSVPRPEDTLAALNAAAAGR